MNQLQLTGFDHSRTVLFQELDGFEYKDSMSLKSVVYENAITCLDGEELEHALSQLQGYNDNARFIVLSAYSETDPCRTAEFTFAPLVKSA